MKCVLALVAVVIAPFCASAVTIDLVPVGNPGNSGDINGGIFGRVTSPYQIGATEITNAQYVEFLNAKAASDPLGLYNTTMGSFSYGGIVRSGSSGSYTYAVKDPAVGKGPGGTDYTYGDKPVNIVTWYDAIRFANWMNNGQGNGDTESGAYTLLGNSPIPTNASTITRSAGATWFLPNENEWYKAAYYNPATSSYYSYPTSSSTAPDNNLPTTDSGNSANFLDNNVTTTGDPGYPMTAAGAYTLTKSPYGTFDQGGNVQEWTETLDSATQKRVVRGGAWNQTSTNLMSATRVLLVPDSIVTSGTGFRLASIAAPAGVPGDYNGNGVVDAADYVIWRDHLGTSFQLMNEVASTTPGMVTQEDLHGVAGALRKHQRSGQRPRLGRRAGTGCVSPADLLHDDVDCPAVAPQLMLLIALYFLGLSFLCYPAFGDPFGGSLAARDALRHTDAAIRVARQREVFVGCHEFLDACDAGQMADVVLRHRARPAGDVGHHRFAGRVQQIGKLFSRNSYEILIGQFEQLGLHGAPNKDANQNMVRRRGPET